MYLIRHKLLNQERPYACNDAFARAFAQQNQYIARVRIHVYVYAMGFRL